MCIDAREAMTWWTWDPLALGPCTVSSALYALGVRRVWSSAGVGHGIRRWEVGCFVAGQLSLLVALCSPIDRLSDLLFSAHMTQHEIILVVAPPLVMLGKPFVALSWLVPIRLPARAHGAWRVLSHPGTALVLHGLVIWLWHVPALFELCLRNEAVHAVQHLSFFATAGLFWWAIVRGRYGRAGYGLAVLFVFATAAHTSILGALFTLADRVAYPMYVARGAPYGIDATDDQRLAGLVMWIPTGVIFTLAALALFAAWLGESGRRVAAATRRRAS